MEQLQNFQTALANTEAAKTLNVYGAQFLTYVYPEMDYTQSPNAGLPFMVFHEAVLVIAVYLFLVSFGYLIMRSYSANKNLKPLVALYNLTQVICCGYLVVETIRTAIALDYTPICNTFDPAVTNNKMPFLLYLFYMTKGLDLFDTLFFVAHKSDRQISFLHVYHHVSIFMVYWVNSNIFYSGDIYYTIIANGFVHFVMYGYYFLTTVNSTGKETKNTVYQFTQALRPYITTLQLFQFVTMMSQAGYILYKSCGSPLIWTKIYFFYILSMFALFMQFFIANYFKPKKGDKSKKLKKKSSEPTRKSKRIMEKTDRHAAAEKDALDAKDKKKK